MTKEEDFLSRTEISLFTFSDISSVYAHCMCEDHCEKKNNCEKKRSKKHLLLIVKSVFPAKSA